MGRAVSHGRRFEYPFVLAHCRRDNASRQSFLIGGTRSLSFIVLVVQLARNASVVLERASVADLFIVAFVLTMASRLVLDVSLQCLVIRRIPFRHSCATASC